MFQIFQSKFSKNSIYLVKIAIVSIMRDRVRPAVLLIVRTIHTEVFSPSDSDKSINPEPLFHKLLSLKIFSTDTNCLGQLSRNESMRRTNLAY